MKKEDTIELLQLLSRLFDKYRIKEIKCSLKTMHTFNKNKEIVEKEMLNLEIKDVHGIWLDKTIYDCLEEENQ